VKRVLLLAYFFPPRVSTGSLRATYLAKYLPRFGWQPTVISARFLDGAPPPWATVIETGYTDVIARAKRLVGVARGTSAHEFLGTVAPNVGSRMTTKQLLVASVYDTLAFPDPHIGWFKHGVPVVKKLLREERWDALISTSYPYTAHLIARRALKGLETPWLADLRDLWRGNLQVTGVRSSLFSLLERKTLKRANAITTVSAPWAEQVAKNNPAIPTFEVRNSFDPDDWIGIPYTRPVKCTLTYAGSLYRGLRDPEPLFDALLEEFRAGTIQRQHLEIVLYTTMEGWLSEAIERRGLQDVVKLPGHVPRRDVLYAERATSANLLLLMNLARATGVYTGKIFEYLGAGRPILTIGGPEQSVVRDVMARAGGWYARSHSEIRIALRTLYQQHTRGDDVRLNPDVADEFSAVSMARSFATLLDGMQAGSS